MRTSTPLTDRVALVTGVSRRIGIGFTLVRRLLADGATVLATGWRPHDEEMPWGPGGRVVLFTSDQHRVPMWTEMAYSISKGAIHQMTLSLAAAMTGQGITVNCINPGPVDTGYATGEDHARVARHVPSGRWGEPDDVARLVAWLVGDEGRWITGQVINSDGGFRLI